MASFVSVNMADAQVAVTRDLARDYIQRVYTNFTQAQMDDSSSTALEYQRRRLEREFDAYMQSQTAVIAACTEEADKAAELKDLSKVDNTYMKLLMMIGESATKHSAAALDQTILAAQAGSSRSRKVPDGLPIFNGSAASWPAFRDLFEALVASQDFSDLEKLICLQKHCTGTAAGVVEGYQPVAASYDLAWGALKDAYEDDYVIAQSFIDKLFDMPVAKHVGASELRRVIDTIRSTLRQLEAMKYPTAQWGALMTNLLARKLPSKLVSEWDQKREHGACPSFEEFVKFAESKARSRVSYGEQPQDYTIGRS